MEYYGDFYFSFLKMCWANTVNIEAVVLVISYF
jgi:hypothetical protein